MIKNMEKNNILASLLESQEKTTILTISRGAKKEVKWNMDYNAYLGFGKQEAVGGFIRANIC